MQTGQTVNEKARRKKRLITVSLLMVLAVALTLAYALLDPAEVTWFPKCIFHLATGYECPGCGLQRALHSLLTGDVAQAFRYNALWLLIFPFIALYALSEIWPKRFPRLAKALNSRTAAIIFFVLIAIWWIVRNILGI